MLRDLGERLRKGIKKMNNKILFYKLASELYQTNQLMKSCSLVCLRLDLKAEAHPLDSLAQREAKSEQKNAANCEQKVKTVASLKSPQ